MCPAALDTTKDPCQKVKCSRHKVCIAQDFQRAMCMSRKKLEHRCGFGDGARHGLPKGKRWLTLSCALLICCCETDCPKLRV